MDILLLDKAIKRAGGGERLGRWTYSLKGPGERLGRSYVVVVVLTRRMRRICSSLSPVSPFTKPTVTPNPSLAQSTLSTSSIGSLLFGSTAAAADICNDNNESDTECEDEDDNNVLSYTFKQP